jgi:hypothetical protein
MKVSQEPNSSGRSPDRMEPGGRLRVIGVGKRNGAVFESGKQNKVCDTSADRRKNTQKY